MMPTTKRLPKPLTDEDLEYLPDVLGELDAAFLPVRGCCPADRSNAHRIREEYPAIGLAWTGRGGRAADAKARQRWAADAADRGLLERLKGTVYSTRVKLTDLGERLARGVCGLFALDQAADLVREVAGFAYTEGWQADEWDGVWVPEWPCLGPASHRAGIELQAVPALLRGWLAANSDADGLVSYQVGPEPVPARLPRMPPARWRVDAAREVWRAALRRAGDRLGVRDDDTARELGSIPLPVSMGYPPRAGRPLHPEAAREWREMHAGAEWEAEALAWLAGHPAAGPAGE